MRREGIELAPAFAANVSVPLSVGNLEETVTVSGSAPVVDVQSVLQQRLVPKDVIDAVPTGKSWSQLGVLMVGVTSIVDVGGSTGEQQNPLAAHGGATGDKIIEMDGMRLGLLLGTTSSTGISSNDASTQDISIDIGAISAESGGGGVRVNVIPKEGGNRYSGSLAGNFANKSMTSSNFSEELRLKGVRAPDRVKLSYDYSGALGGPLKRDKLWFFTAQRWWGYQNLQSNAFYENNPVDYLYDPSTDPDKTGVRRSDAREPQSAPDLADQPEEQAGRLLRLPTTVHLPLDRRARPARSRRLPSSIWRRTGTARPRLRRR